MKKFVSMTVAVCMLSVMLMAGTAQAGLLDALKDAVSGVVDNAGDIVSEAMDGVKDILGEAADVVSDALEEAKTALDQEIAADDQDEDPAALKDGEYEIEVTLEGGSGRASVLSPCVIRMEDGAATAVIVWSSENYDYMIVNDEKIDPVRIEGGSTFEIPVEDLTAPLQVIADTTAMSQPHEIEYTLFFDIETLKTAGAETALEDGEYTAEFDTDSSMFHVNEACEGKGVLTVKDGEMTIHVSLVSKKIVNLFPGLAEDAAKEGAELLEPTVDEVTYSDGWTEEVFGFDIPVPVIGEEFDLAILGTKGEWYDHKVSVSNPVPVE